MSSNVASVFDAFVQAKEAIEKVPALEQQMAEMQHRIDVLTEQRNAAEAEADLSSRRISELKDELKSREADLAQSTFHEAELGSKLQTILSVLKGTMTEAAAAVELVEPKPEPVVEPAPEVDPVPEPISQIPTSNPVAASDTTTASDGGTLPGTFTSGSGFTSYHEDYSPPMAMPEGQSANPPTAASNTASSTDLPSTLAPPIGVSPPASTPPVAPSEDASPSNPKQPYWEKPKDMTWERWEAAGNDIPYWYHRAS